MWQKISKNILQSINERFNKFELSFQRFIVGQQALTERVCDMEKQAEDHEQRIGDMETSLAELQQENKVLRSKLSSLEGRSRCNIIKIIGVPEGEEKGRPMEFVSHLIPKLLGAENFDKSVVIDSAPHAAYIIARVHLAEEKEKIIQLGRWHALDYGGQRILIFLDYTVEVMEQRRGFREALKLLREKNIQHSLHFPAWLHIHHQGQVKAFILALSLAPEKNEGNSASFGEAMGGVSDCSWVHC
uniref:L1 transposable element RRM domain-containing protein n=1 Tax=Monopterus albus TaxID=43700 RepID=A0A3Q3J0S5_MONAL